VSTQFAPIQFEPAYRKIAAAIGERILGRALREGDRLPPETELARQFGVHRSTVREALRELESRGLVTRRPGSKLMSVSRPQRTAVAAGVSDALRLHDVTVRDVWQALTILEPPIAVAAARARTAEDLRRIAAAAAALREGAADTGTAVHQTAEVFRCIGQASHNPVLALAQEPLLQLLEPSLRVMIDKVPQARSRIITAQQHLTRSLENCDAEGAHTWMARHIRDFRRGYELAGIDFTLQLTADAAGVT
jgi:GntR family transcriptional regulator, transcriptional repressor for pyruvate dehydrogenase complex